MVGWGALSDHSVGLNVQVPVDPKNNIKSIKLKDKQNHAKNANWKGRGLSTHTAGLYGAGVGPVVVGVAGWACLSSGAEPQGLTPGVLGEMGVVGSTWKQRHTWSDHTKLADSVSHKSLHTADYGAFRCCRIVK